MSSSEETSSSSTTPGQGQGQSVKCSSGLPPARPAKHIPVVQRKKVPSGQTASLSSKALCKLCSSDESDLDLDLVLLEEPGGKLTSRLYCTSYRISYDREKPCFSCL